MSPNETLTPSAPASGFARAAGAPSATAIVTDGENVLSGPTTVPSQGDAMPAWMARPAGQHDALPVVIVVQEMRAAAAWYGKLTGDKTLTMPKHPVDVATQLTAPVLGLYGAQDKSIPLETIETMRQALRAANADAEIVVYPEAGHAFNADYRPSYHAPSAQDGWQRMLAWFARFGVK